ncbi:MAG: class IV adenylate cyclase [Desulfobacteraceae bacterium]|jgi:adenylate cyclase class 2
MAKAAKNDLEIEVKFFLADEKLIRNKITALGKVFKTKSFEFNIRYENQDESLLSKRILLRLRKDNQVHLTVKTAPIAQQKQSEFKILRELEVTVDDFDKMNQILIALGFHQVQIYEKWRETLVFDNTIICLDSLPFGTFLEIEGSKEKILSTAKVFGLDWSCRILSNYLEIFEYLKKKERLDFNDLTFENFKKHQIHFEDYHHFFLVNKTI